MLIDKIDVTKISLLKAKEIKEIASSLNEDEYNEFIDIFKNDDRKSVISIRESIRKKLDKIRVEDDRIEKINAYEDDLYSKGYMNIAGLDEAGRGPLAGPVVAACVVFDKGQRIRWIDDSKKLKEEKRELLYDIIISHAKDYSIGICTNDEIDEHNILNATYIAMKRALDGLKQKPDFLLNDAVTLPNIDIKQLPIIKGDSKSMSIAAASILAKVTRDRIMYEFDKSYPVYGFAKNKGYGTKEHYQAIEKYGITPIHRLSFLKNLY